MLKIISDNFCSIEKSKVQMQKMIAFLDILFNEIKYQNQ